MNTNLKEYVSHKRVHAEPMTISEYEIEFKKDNPGIRSSKVDTTGYGANKEGYHMVYDLGTPDEYHSWQPKHKMDEGYSLLPESFLDRLKLEYKDLAEKNVKLCEFLCSKGADNLSSANRDLLGMQTSSMSDYLAILNIRLELLLGKC